MTIESQYEDWESALREYIQRMEAKRYLGTAEIAKALLLYGMKAYADLNRNAVSGDRLNTFVCEIRRRTAAVVENRQATEDPG